MKIIKIIIKVIAGVFVAHVVLFFVWIVLMFGCVTENIFDHQSCGDNLMTDVVRGYYNVIFKK